MPQELTKTQKTRLGEVQTTGEKLAAIVRGEQHKLSGQSGFDQTILVGREYPGRLQRGILRGADRLAIAAEGVAAAAHGAQCLQADTPVKPWTPRPVGEFAVERVKGKVFVDRAAVKKVLAPLSNFVEQSQHHRATIGRMETNLAAGGSIDKKGVAAVQKMLLESRQTFADFEFYLKFAEDHASKMVTAITNVDEKKNKQYHFPAAKLKGRPPRVDKFHDKAKTVGSTRIPAGKWPGANATKQQIACWLARKAQEAKLPPLLPLVCAIPESGLDAKVMNGQGSGAVGLFQIMPNIHPAPAGFGSASGHKQPASWWAANPEAQWKWFVKEANAFKPSGDVSGKNVANWAYAIERPGPAHRHIYGDSYAKAQAMLKGCAMTSTGAANVPSNRTANGVPKTADGKKLYNAEALRIALSQMGVKEVNGSNWGPKVGEYLRSTDINFPAHWCAAFVHWALEKAGFKFPDGDRKWAACVNYLAEARKKDGAFYAVSAKDAKPGDLLVFNDGHHIAMVKSQSGNSITVVGGNQSNAVTTLTHQINGSFTIIRPRAQ